MTHHLQKQKRIIATKSSTIVSRLDCSKTAAQRPHTTRCTRSIACSACAHSSASVGALCSSGEWWAPQRARTLRRDACFPGQCLRGSASVRYVSLMGSESGGTRWHCSSAPSMSRSNFTLSPLSTHCGRCIEVGDRGAYLNSHCQRRSVDEAKGLLRFRARQAIPEEDQ